MIHVSVTGSEIRPIYCMPPFLLYVDTSKKHSDSSRFARLVVNLAALVRGESDHEMKPKTCTSVCRKCLCLAFVLGRRKLRVEFCLRIIRKVI